MTTRHSIYLLPVLVLLCLTVSHPGRATMGHAYENAPSLRSVAEPALAAVVAELPAPPPAPVHRLVGSVRQYTARAMVYLPAGLSMADDGQYDLIIHFHGGPPVVEPRFQKTGMNAVLATINLGISSGPYQRHFNRPAIFEELLEAINKVVKKRGPLSLPAKGAAKVGRRKLALSAWSAGYGAIKSILIRPENAKLVDAVFLADGMHGGFAHKHTRRPHDRTMQPYMAFAKAAIAGNKLMRITHSQIATVGYASTTETARYLVKGFEIPSVDAVAPSDMTLTHAYQKGLLSVQGFEGADKAAHCDHVWNIAQFVFEPLQKRWGHPV